jgi:hypothetical protein
MTIKKSKKTEISLWISGIVTPSVVKQVALRCKWDVSVVCTWGVYFSSDFDGFYKLVP